MPTSSYLDFTAGVRAIGARTDSAGVAATDLGSDEDRLINHILTEGYLSHDAFKVAADSPASMDVIVGSGTAKADRYVVAGDDDGQHPYIVRLDDASITVTLDAADASNPRIDELWLVVADATWDAGSVSLPRIGYRKGDAGASPSAPGADSSWKAAVKLATVTVAASATSVDAGDIADNRTAASLAVPLAGTWEVDGSTEVASYSLTGTYAAAATVSLTIPSDWKSWKCYAAATFAVSSTGTTDNYNARISIDGTVQQAIEGVGASAALDNGAGVPTPSAVAARRSGMTTTGARDVVLQLQEMSGTIESQDIFLYARAVRTS